MTQADRIRRYADLIQKQTGRAVRPYRADGYVNLITRYGTSKDQSEQYKFVPEEAVPDELLTMYYEGNGLFAKIIDTPAEEAIKHGFSLDDVADQEVEDFYSEALDELGWEETAMTAIKWARLFGGSIAVMLINDGRGLDEPLDWKNIQSIDDIRVFDRSLIQPDYASMFSYDPQDPFRTRGSRLGMPEFYQVFSKYGNFTVHDSRCLVFQNGILPENTTNSVYQLWGIPEYIRINRAIRDAEIAHRSAPKLLDRSVQPVYKMKDLSQELATEEGESVVLRRLQVIDMARGLLNSLVIDSDGEDYDFKTFQFTGVNDVVSASCNMLSAITNIPQTILFGQSVGGLSSTDDTSMENYYNYVERIQKRMLKSNLRYLLSVIFQAGLATGEVDEIPKLKVKFNPLWSLSDTEQADLELKKAQIQQTKAATAQIYVQMEAIDPSEVRKKLADSEDFDVENMLDEYDEEDLFTGMQEQMGAPEGETVPGDVATGTGKSIFQQGDFDQYAQNVSVEEHNADPNNGGNAPTAAPAATKLPQDMSDEEIAEKAAKAPENEDSAEEVSTSYAPAKTASVGVLVVSDGKILSGTRHNDFGYGLICGPGGHVEEGETPEQAAFRETEEEFGISPKELIPLGYGPKEPDTGLAPELFLCTAYDGEPECLDLEMSTPEFRSLEELAELGASLFHPFKDSLEILKKCLASDHDDGGPGSGNFGHAGVPGQVGGSAPSNESRPVVQAKDVFQGYSGDTDIKSVLKAQGFDGLPKVVKQDEFDEAVKASSFVSQRTYTASSQEVLDAYRAQLYNGEWYVDCSTGGAQYGQGMYCAADYEGKLTDGIKAEMEHYQELGQHRATPEAAAEYAGSLKKEDFENSPYSRNLKLSDEEVRVFTKLKSDQNLTGYKLPEDERKIWQDMIRTGKMTSMNLTFSDLTDSFLESYKAPSFIETMTLTPDAKIVKYNDILKMRESDGAETIDLGAYAALKGYDAINAENHGESGSYTVILNRTKTIILDGNGNADGKGESVITFREGKNGVVYAVRGDKIIGWVITPYSIISEKPIDKSAQSATIKSKETTEDGGPGSGNFGHEGRPGQQGGSGHTLGAREKAKITKRLVGQKTHDGIEIRSVSSHAFDRIGGRKMSVGRIDKMRTEGKASPGNRPHTRCYDIDGSRMVIDTDSGNVMTVMWRGGRKK